MQKPRTELHCFRKVSKSSVELIVLNPNRYELGRSAYVCKSDECIKIAVKGKKILKMLRAKNSSASKILELKIIGGTEHGS